MLKSLTRHMHTGEGKRKWGFTGPTHQYNFLANSLVIRYSSKPTFLSFSVFSLLWQGNSSFSTSLGFGHHLFQASNFHLSSGFIPSLGSMPSHVLNPVSWECPQASEFLVFQAYLLASLDWAPSVHTQVYSPDSWWHMLVHSCNRCVVPLPYQAQHISSWVMLIFNSSYCLEAKEGSGGTSWGVGKLLSSEGEISAASSSTKC